jgi:hypothetical protein
MRRLCQQQCLIGFGHHMTRKNDADPTIRWSDGDRMVRRAGPNVILSAHD